MKKKLLKLSKVMEQADNAFSLFIRQRDNNRCVICGSALNPQCGHLIKRGKHNTRFDELNCNCQCRNCNFKHNQYPEHYTNWFIKKHGVKKYSELFKRSQEIKKWSRNELNELINYYKTKTKEV